MGKCEARRPWINQQQKNGALLGAQENPLLYFSHPFEVPSLYMDRKQGWRASRFHLATIVDPSGWFAVFEGASNNP
ncbi:MAG: hypothetical protein WAM70_15755 [Pyrinomonadaceae bacterium]